MNNSKQKARNGHLIVGMCSGLNPRPVSPNAAAQLHSRGRAEN